MREQREINKYITEPEDFLHLPEKIQDSLTYNTKLDYITIWDKLSYELKIEIIMNNPNFNYKSLWSQLGNIERENVIQYSKNFDWKKYTPNPNDNILNLLIGRYDFFGEEKFFDDLSYENKLRICSKPKLPYKKYWNKITNNLKLEIVKRNNNFDPKNHIKELQEIIVEDYDETNFYNNKRIERTLLDIYCNRKYGNKYDSIWNDINNQQKMDIAIKNKDFIVGDKVDELFELFKNYPIKMVDFINNKIIPEQIFYNKEIEIDFNDMSEDIKKLSILLIKSFSLINLNKILELRKEKTKGNITTYSISVDLEKYIPVCVVKVDDIEEIKHRGTSLRKGFYLYHIHNDKYTRIKDYNYILRESKLERLLKL